ncbi:RNA polymerase sigma factor [Pseudoalteromonas sp. BSi20652]|uniref:RNA polymerase sigma factor n=1 Tax=Pseudoalteromonas sp. BSi20652 TaxID=388384 RepID=UPI001ED941B8|nr:RNA polymerase sigma factor [Pseudoalteromonas sp. BSi20652]
MKTFKSPLPSNLNISSEQSDVKNVVSHIRKFISRRTNNTDDVDDLVQEALLRTLTRNDTSEIENFQAYINQVAKSVMYSDWQKNKRQPNNAEDIELFTNDNSDPEAQSITEQKLELVKNALQELPPLRRKVFKLRRIDGLSREEISLQLNISQESVKKHITRAMIQITLHIEKNQ